MKYIRHFQTTATPQSEKIPGSSQVENSAGGFSWAVDKWTRFDRFLILGSEGGSYYASEHKLTIDNAQSVLECIKSDGQKAVERIVEISTSGRAPKADPALFALAMAASLGDAKTKAMALDALPAMAYTGTQLFTFIENTQGFRGWGRGLRRAIGKWYTEKTPEKLAYQLVKYRQRNGWTHKDALRLAHPKSTQHQALFHWTVKNELSGELPELIQTFTKLQNAKTVKEVVGLIDENVTWEMIPTEFLGEAKIWEALLPNMPMTAMIRNLGRMSANGLIKPLSKSAKLIAERLRDKERIAKAKIHPIAVLGALTTYESGHGAKGKLSWDAVPQVVDALNDAFYLSFGNVEPSGKRQLLALDVSGSMEIGEIAGMPGLTPRNASAAMALVTERVEKECFITAFSNTMVPVSISAKQRLDDVVKYVDRLKFGGTDCALPMLYALKKGLEVDTFIVYTDSETWAGNIHPTQALKQYRQKTGIPAKLVVVGMVANEFTIADPNDLGMMDVVGFDTATPNLISDFAKQ